MKDYIIRGIEIKKKGDINNFRNKIKLTEFIMYNKTKEKIINEKFGLK